MNQQLIDEIKLRGQIDALSSAITSKIFEITNRTFEKFKVDGVLKDLHQKLETVRSACDVIDELLTEVNKLDGKST